MRFDTDYLIDLSMAVMAISTAVMTVIIAMILAIVFLAIIFK